MKKLILFSILTMALGRLDAQNLFLKPLSSNDTARYYYLVKPGETRRQEVKDSASGQFLISQYITMETDTILDTILVIGEAGRTDYIIRTYQDKTFYTADETEVEELGFSKWGFKKKLRLTTSHDSYYRLSQEPATIVVKPEIKIEEKSRFAFTSLLKLIMISLLGLMISNLVFRPRKLLENLALSAETLLGAFVVLIFGLLSAYQGLYMGPIFITLGAVCFFLPIIRRVIKWFRNRPTKKGRIANNIG